MDTRFKVVPGVALLIERDNKFLLLKRSQACSYGGYYCAVGGHVDGNETMRQAAAREAFEEVGIIVKPEDMTFLHVVHRNDPPVEVVTFFFKVSNFQGEPYNKEPEKHDELVWVTKDQLPQPLFHTLESYLQDPESHYSEFGWQNYRQ